MTILSERQISYKKKNSKNKYQQRTLYQQSFIELFLRESKINVQLHGITNYTSIHIPQSDPSLSKQRS